MVCIHITLWHCSHEYRWVTIVNRIPDSLRSFVTSRSHSLHCQYCISLASGLSQWVDITIASWTTLPPHNSVIHLSTTLLGSFLLFTINFYINSNPLIIFTSTLWYRIKLHARVTSIETGVRLLYMWTLYKTYTFPLFSTLCTCARGKVMLSTQKSPDLDVFVSTAYPSVDIVESWLHHASNPLAKFMGVANT